MSIKLTLASREKMCVRINICKDTRGLNMKCSFRRAIAILALTGSYLFCGTTGAMADPVLSVVSMDKNYPDGGVYDGGNVSYSTGGDWGIFLAPGGLTGSPSYLNTNDSSTSLGISLAPGNYQFSGYFVNTTGIEAGAMSLYFDGSASSNIAAFVDSTNVPSAAGFSAFSGNVVAPGGDSFITGAGSLTYVDGNFAITLTQFAYYDSTQVSDLDPAFAGVGYHVSSPPLTGDTFNAFTFGLSVVDLPEPASLMFLAPASFFLARLRWRRASAMSR